MTVMMESLTTELRITGRIMRETMLGMRRTGWMNLIILITMASILSIFGVIIAMIMEFGILVHQLGSDLEISVYLKNGQDSRIVEKNIADMPHISKVTLISKERAWADMQKEYPIPDVDNPLPDTIHVRMSDVKMIPQTVDAIKRIPAVEAVQYAKNVLDKIRHISRGATIVGIAFSLFLGILTTFIISNTIHLLIEAKSREIEILRMMGVGNWYIRLPFLFQGGLYGLLGGLIAYFPLNGAMYWLDRFFDFFGFQTSDSTLISTTVILLIMGMVVGSSGAAFAVRKYLHI